jgi:hypothetical protein
MGALKNRRARAIEFLARQTQNSLHRLRKNGICGPQGVKTPDESNALTSWLKPGPTNLPSFSAACSNLFDFEISPPMKFKIKIQKPTG